MHGCRIGNCETSMLNNKKVALFIRFNEMIQKADIKLSAKIDVEVYLRYTVYLDTYYEVLQIVLKHIKFLF